MEKPLLAWHLSREQHSQPGLASTVKPVTLTKPLPFAPHGHLLHQMWGETLEVTLSKNAAVELHWLLSKYIFLYTRSKAGAHNPSYCNLANTWQLISPVLTSPPLACGLFLHHLKMFFITGAWGLAQRFKTTAVRSDSTQSQRGCGSPRMPLLIAQGHLPS